VLNKCPKCRLIVWKIKSTTVSQTLVCSSCESEYPHPNNGKLEAIRILTEAENLIKNGMYQFVKDKIAYAKGLLR